MTLVFVVQFTNTGFIVLITSWNFLEVNEYLFAESNRGSTDFTSEWYESTGYLLVTTMIIQIFNPIIEFLVYGLYY